MFIFDSVRVITCLVKSVFFIRHGWRKGKESCHKICFKASLSATETLVLLQKAYGNEALNQSKVFRWYSRFRDGRGLVKNEERGGRPKSTSTELNIPAVADLVINGRQIASRMMAKSLEIPKTLVLLILKGDLGKRKLCARFVPHSLTPEQREDRVTSCKDIIAMADEKKKNYYERRDLVMIVFVPCT